MLVGGVVRHEIEHDLEASRVRLRDEAVEVLERAEERIDTGVVRHVVAEVLHRRGIDRREPQRVDAQPSR